MSHFARVSEAEAAGEIPDLLIRFGERGRIRTCDPRLKRALLYHLSYAPSPISNLTYFLRWTLQSSLPRGSVTPPRKSDTLTVNA